MRCSLEGSRDDRVHVPTTCRATNTGTALHHYAGLNYKPLARRITSYLRDVAVLSDPRDRGKGLTGPLAGLWRYRVGNYRIICDLNDEHLVIIAVAIDHRSQVYR